MVTIFAWNETELDQWFNENYEMLGFSKIELPEKPQLFGDYIGWKDGKRYRIELEQTTSQFFLHKPEVRNRIDIIICWRRWVSRLKWKEDELRSKEIIAVASLVTEEETALYRHLHRLVDVKKMGESLAKKKVRK